MFKSTHKYSFYPINYKMTIEKLPFIDYGNWKITNRWIEAEAISNNENEYFLVSFYESWISNKYDEEFEYLIISK